VTPADRPPAATGGPLNVAAAFPPELSTLATARRFVLSVLANRDLPDDLVDAAVLLTSELAANAAQHAPGHDVRIRIMWRGDVLRIQVEDGNDDVPVPPTSTGLDEWTGLRVVETLAADWGVEQRAVGKTVWFELRPSP
jgi:anti-sigma regulatory factor (Ser/Thr protein kinase)